MTQLLSLAGAVFVLFAFSGLQLGRLDPGQFTYQLANLVGAALLTAAAVMTQTWGFIILNAVWGAFAVVKLAELARHRAA
jgi:uncharacterized membrane protein